VNGDAAPDTITPGPHEDSFADGTGSKPLTMDSYSSCSGGVLGIGDKCKTTYPTITGKVDGTGATLEIVFSGALVKGSNTLDADSFYRDPKTPDAGLSFKLTNASVELLELAPSSAKISGATLVGYLCGRGKADLTLGSNVVGSVTFKIKLVSPYAETAMPACDP